MNFLKSAIAAAAFGFATFSAASAQENGVVTETHGDWEILCASTDKQRCVLQQAYKTAEGRPLAVVKIARFENRSLPDGTKIPAQLEVLVPLGVVLQNGLSFQVDSKETRIAPYRFCVQSGCRVLEPLTDGFVAELKGGATAKLSFRSVDGKTRDAPISLSGFTKGYNALTPAQ